MLYMFRAVSPPIIRSPNTLQRVSGMCQAYLLLLLAVAASNPGPDAVCTVLELLMMGGETARNM